MTWCMPAGAQLPFSSLKESRIPCQVTSTTHSGHLSYLNYHSQDNPPIDKTTG